MAGAVVLDKAKRCAQNLRAAFFVYNFGVSQEKSQRPRLTVSNLESVVDKQIREAMERGDFDNLRGAGKPLDLARDPNVPEDWELAYHLLKNAGFAPDWIETRKEIDAARAKLFAPLERFLKNIPALPNERARLEQKIVEQFRAQAAELNKLIDVHNLKAPNVQVHLRRIRVEHEIERFREQVAGSR